MAHAVALILLFVSVVAEAQPAARRHLIGRVIDSTGGSLPGAFVTVRPSQQPSGLPELEAISDDAGRFRFEDIPPGSYRVAGHLFGFQLGQSMIEVASDQDTEVSVVLLVGTIIDCVSSFSNPVRIRTKSGESLPTAFLTVTGPGHRPQSEAVSPTGSTSQCFAPGTEDQVTLDVLGYGEKILKRSGLDPKSVAWQITIDPSPASRLGRAARPYVTGQIRGRVFDQYGASIPDATVSFEPYDPQSGLTAFQAVTDSRGRFDFIGVRPGTYRVTGKAVGLETTVFTQEVVAGEDTEVTVVVRRQKSSVRFAR